MDSVSAATESLVWAGSAFLILAVMRVGWLFMADGDPTLEVWRRRWIEVGALVAVGVAVALVAVMLS